MNFLKQLKEKKRIRESITINEAETKELRKKNQNKESDLSEIFNRLSELERIERKHHA